MHPRGWRKGTWAHLSISLALSLRWSGQVNTAQSGHQTAQVPELSLSRTHTHFPQTPHYCTTVSHSRCWHGVIPRVLCELLRSCPLTAPFKIKSWNLTVFPLQTLSYESIACWSTSQSYVPKGLAKTSYKNHFGFPKEQWTVQNRLFIHPHAVPDDFLSDECKQQFVDK